MNKPCTDEELEELRRHHDCPFVFFNDVYPNCGYCRLLATIDADRKELEIRFKQLCDADERLALMTELKDKRIKELEESIGYLEADLETEDI